MLIWNGFKKIIALKNNLSQFFWGKSMFSIWWFDFDFFVPQASISRLLIFRAFPLKTLTSLNFNYSLICSDLPASSGRQKRTEFNFLNGCATHHKNSSAYTKCIINRWKKNLLVSNSFFIEGKKVSSIISITRFFTA